MAEQKESSVLFSLKELMGLEEDRIRDEESKKEAEARAAHEARVAAERAAREAEEARIRTAEEDRQREEQRRKEDETRLDAIRQAEIERARVETEQRARLAAMSAQQQHEVTMATLTQDKHKKRLQIMVGVIGGVLLIGGVGGIMAYQNSQAEHARRTAIELAQRKEVEEKLARMQREFADAEAKSQELTRSLAGAKDEAERARLQAELEKAQKAAKAASGAIRGGGATKAAKPGGPACNPNDPLCGF